MNRVLQDIAQFFKGHWPHVVLAIPAAIAFTALHELAHCAAAWVQGGSVTEFVWLPSAAEWGHMRYSFPAGAHYSATAISLAPYVSWLFLCFLAVIISLRRSPWPFWAGSTIFVWLFIVPLADIANTAVPYVLWDSDNDFRSALGPTRPSILAGVVAFGLLSAGLGFILQKRLYRERAVGLAAYCVLASTGALMILAITSLRSI